MGIPDKGLRMCMALKRVSMGVRWGVLGLISGVLSCAMADSRLIYLAREQKTVDHIVWPGIVFGLFVLLPMSRWAGDTWLRTTTALIASSTVYPIAWRIAIEPTIRRSADPFMITAFGLAGFLGSFVLASVFLSGRPRWVKPALAAVIFGTLVGGLMGAHLCWALPVVSARDGLALLLVVWQTTVGAAIGRGVTARSDQAAAEGMARSSRNSAPED